MKKQNPQPKVNIRKSGIGYLIEIQDPYVKSSPLVLAVTKQELELIVLYGQEILNELVN